MRFTRPLDRNNFVPHPGGCDVFVMACTALIEAFVEEFSTARRGTSIALGFGSESSSKIMPAIPTHCPYCALQCGMLVAVDERGTAGVTADPKFPVNLGGLCLKGWTAAETLAHGERLRAPLVRVDGVLVATSWDAALDAAAARIRDTQQRHGRDAVGVLGGGSLTNEKVYLLGKFARVALGTANIDYNGRFCMSSAAAAATRAFGIDRGLPFPLADLGKAALILLVGANPAATMPPLMRYFERQQRDGGMLIVADPRRTATAAWAGRHLALRPGSDTALANGLLHVLITDKLIDRDYIETRTEHFEEARRVAMGYWPERVEQITGLPERTIIDTAHLLGEAPSAMILTARGPEQQARGVTNALAYLNLALAAGLPGRPFSGFGTLTGQGNGQGGREHGQKTDQLPGYRRLDDPDARRHLAGIWGIDEQLLPIAGKSAYELLDSLGSDIRSLFVMGFNPAVSAPNALHVGKRLRALDTLIVTDFFLSETAQLADIVLPSAQWAEEEGTMTNLEGRVLHRRRAVAPVEGCRTDLEILTAIAARLGHASRFPSAEPRHVFDELRRASQGAPADYSGITYERIDAEDGVFWPCPDDQHPGTPRLFGERFPTPSGRARFHATPEADVADARDADYPLHLTTGRILQHYQTANQTRRVAELAKAAPEAVAEMHPRTARLAGIADGSRITLTTRRAVARFTVKLTRDSREDTVFVPFHGQTGEPVNRLTNDALDPISRMPEFKVCAVHVAPCGNEDLP
jgi:assimilatory nitrate reductase catalytic subunit